MSAREIGTKVNLLYIWRAVLRLRHRRRDICGRRLSSRPRKSCACCHPRGSHHEVSVVGAATRLPASSRALHERLLRRSASAIRIDRLVGVATPFCVGARACWFRRRQCHCVGTVATRRTSLRLIADCRWGIARASLPSTMRSRDRLERNRPLPELKYHSKTSASKVVRDSDRVCDLRCRIS